MVLYRSGIQGDSSSRVVWAGKEDAYMDVKSMLETACLTCEFQHRHLYEEAQKSLDQWLLSDQGSWQSQDLPCGSIYYIHIVT